MDHFVDLTQIRQLTQSDSIILILYVDDNKKPQNGLLKASRPPPRGRTLTPDGPEERNIGVTVGLFEMGVSHLENSPWAPPKASKNPPRDPPHYGGEPLKIREF